MMFTVAQTCIAAIFSTLIAQSAAAPAQVRSPLEDRAVTLTGPVIFLSNCINTNGASYGEFDYYSDVKNTVLKGKTTAPTLKNVINPTSSVDYIDGGTFVTVGTAPDFYAILSIDENDFAGAGSRVGNGKSTSYFWAQVCYQMTRATVYKPTSAVTCTADIYCLQGPVDTTDL